MSQSLLHHMDSSVHVDYLPCNLQDYVPYFVYLNVLKCSIGEQTTRNFVVPRDVQWQSLFYSNKGYVADVLVGDGRGYL